MGRDKRRFIFRDSSPSSPKITTSMDESIPTPPSESGKPPLPLSQPSFIERLLTLFEHGWILMVMGSAISIAAVFIDGRYFPLMCLPILLGAHRSRAFDGMRLRNQIISYSLLLAVSCGMFWELGIRTNKAREHFPTLDEISNAVARKLSPQKEGKAREAPLPQPLTTPTKQKSQSPASLGIVMYDTDDLRFWLVDTGDIAADKPKVTIGLANLSNQYMHDYDGKGEKPQPLPIPTREIDDYVRPHESLETFIVLNDLSRPFVKKGDRLLGEVRVVCLNCDRQRTFWVFWVVGIGGWYYEVPAGHPTNIPFIQSKDWTDSQIDAAANDLAPFNKRISIRHTLEDMQNSNGAKK